ncbi:MAG: protein phosphatase 2C domain-containing protein [Bacteroidota bacterium]|nr:protein phosphatase 2C domain-containing protein [Bacteroidota bacterium]
MEAAVAKGQIRGGRGSQQDAAEWCQWEPGCFLMILADGIGGTAGGEVASRVAVDGFCNSFMESDHTEMPKRLREALTEANKAVYHKKMEVPDLAEMGTTLIGAAIENGKLSWISVGDSPLWLIREGRMHRLNENHSVGGLLDMRAAAGEITSEEAEQSTRRHILLEAIQGLDLQYVDAPTEPTQLVKSDTVIVASDGVETCSEEELAEISTAGRPSAADIVGAILDAIDTYKKPYQDNATLIVHKPRF